MGDKELTRNRRKEKYQIYTDGACSGNPGPGGWAALILKDGSVKCSLSGRCDSTTNNRMELLALIKGIRQVISIIKERERKDIEIEIYSDSKYLVDGINIWLQKWKSTKWKNSRGEQVKNIDLWGEIDLLLKDLKYRVVWVKGHDTNVHNNTVNKLAVEEISKIKD